MSISKEQQIKRKNAHCPFCGALLCTGFLGKSIQIVCRGKNKYVCGKLIEINFSETGVQVEEVF